METTEVISKLIEEKKRIAARNKEIDDYFVSHQEEMKSLFIGKCFIVNGYDKTIYLYRVKEIHIDSREKYIQDFECDNGYCVFDKEIEVSYRSADYEKYIFSIRNHRFMGEPNLYNLYNSIKEVSEDEFFEELKKTTHIENIESFPNYPYSTKFYDSNCGYKISA